MIVECKFCDSTYKALNNAELDKCKYCGTLISGNAEKVQTTEPKKPIRLLETFYILPIVFYVGVGFIQFLSAFAALNTFYSVHWLLSIPISFVLGYIPILGPIIGYIGARNVWGWSLEASISLFIIPHIFVLLSWLLSGFGTVLFSLRSKSFKTFLLIMFILGSYFSIIHQKDFSNAIQVDSSTDREGVGKYLSGQEIFNKYSKNIVLLFSDVSTGTGIMINPAWLVTNRHVVISKKVDTLLKYNPLKFRFQGDIIVEKFVKIICSKRVDLCFINLYAPIDVQTIDFSDPQIYVGEDTFVIGHPIGLNFPNLTKGNVSSELLRIPRLDLLNNLSHFSGFTTSAPVSPGSSGSPVFNSTGKLIGIISSTLASTQNTNLAISSIELKAFEKPDIDTFTIDFNQEQDKLNLLFNNGKNDSNYTPSAGDINSFEKLITCNTSKHTVVLDKNVNGILRYRSWPRGETSADPEISLDNGTYMRETNENYNLVAFVFKNGSYKYQISFRQQRSSDKVEAVLSVAKGSKLLAYWNCGH